MRIERGGHVVGNDGFTIIPMDPKQAAWDKVQQASFTRLSQYRAYLEAYVAYERALEEWTQLQYGDKS